MKINVTEDICYAQPKSLKQRLAIGNDFIRRYHFPLPFAVDDMDNAADLAYAAWPERIYILSEDGNIAYRGGMGPFNYNPDEARAWLQNRFGAPTPSAGSSISHGLTDQNLSARAKSRIGFLK